MALAGVTVHRTVQEIIHDYKQGILKGGEREKPAERRTQAIATRLSAACVKGAKVLVAKQQ